MPIVNYLQFSRGMNYSISPFLRRPDELKILNGCNVDHVIGSMTKDLGYSQIGATLESGKNITGMFNFRQDGTTQKMLAIVNDATDDDTQLFYSTGGNWTELTGAETAWANKAGVNVEMEALDSYCYFVGHGATDGFLPPRSLTGTTFGTTNTTSMPNAKYAKRYRDRLYLGNTDISGTATPYRVYYSTVPSGGSITWTTATNFLDVDYSEVIKGLGENWDRLVIFTEYSAYFYNQVQFKKAFDVGCASHRTIKNSGAFMLWTNQDGVWASTGGRPLNISGKMIDFIRAGTASSYFAEVVDEEYHLFIGDVTVDGISYSNVRLTFNIPHQTWRMRELADNVTIFAKYNDSGNIELWHGDADGEVMAYSKYSDASPVYSDDGTAIKSHFLISRLDFGEPHNLKVLNRLFAYTEKAQHLELFGRVVDNKANVLMDWKSLGQCKKLVNEFALNSVRGHFLEIQGRENSTFEPWQLDGIGIDIKKDSEND